jgi:hypothetical protein
MRRRLLFEQFKENLSLAREFTGTVRDGWNSGQAAWRKATSDKRAIWLLVPTVIAVSAVAEHFSKPWYYELALMLLVVVLVRIGSGLRRAMWRRRLP